MSAAQGWYDDGSGRKRWWDGDQWTEHYATVVVDESTESTASPASGLMAGLVGKAKDATSQMTSAALQNLAYAKDAMASNNSNAEVAVAASEAMPLFEIISHIDGKNAKVRLWPDRLEWERGRGISAGKITAGIMTAGTSFLLTGVKAGKDAYEMVPLGQVTSVANRKDGMLYHLVEVQTAGGTVAFRVSRNDAAQFRQAILDQLQTRANTPVIVQVANTVPEPVSQIAAAPDHVDQLQKLAQLRDAGILTEEEFATKKAEILARM